MASKFTIAILIASTTFGFQLSEVVNCNKPCLPPPPALPLSRRPSFSTVTEIFNLAIGLISRTKVPSGRNISTSCKLATRDADTWTTLLLYSRAKLSISFKVSIFTENSASEIGSISLYNL